MRKIAFLFALLVATTIQLFAQTLTGNDTTIIHPGVAKTWPAGPYSQVYTNMGIMSTSIPIINLKGKGQTSLEFTLVHRSYNSAANLAIYGVGRGWSHTGVNFLLASNGVIRGVANRATDKWIPNVNTGLFDRKPGTHDNLTQISGGYKVVDYSSKNQFFYDRFDGVNAYYLTKIVDPFGNQVTYAYVNGTTNLSRITDASGRYIDFTYGGTNTNILTRIHLQAGSYFREWDFGYVSHVVNGVTNSFYLNSVTFPSPDTSSQRPSILFDQDDAGKIVNLRTYTTPAQLGKLWHYTYSSIYSGQFVGLTAINQPSKTDPTVVDTGHTTTFAYTFSGTNGTAGAEANCVITDAMGFSYAHAYYNDYNASSPQCQPDFPYPIKRINDPVVTVFVDPRNSQVPTSWNFYEQYVWNPADATCITYVDRQGTTTKSIYDSAGRGLLTSRTIVNQDGNHVDSYFYNSGNAATEGKMSQHVDAAGTITNYAYDPSSGALTQVAVDPSGENITSNVHYNSSGQVDMTWTAGDPTTQYANFDIYGNPRSVIPPNGFATTYTYDDFNNKTLMTEPAPKGTTSFTYDLWNRLIRTTFPDTRYTENGYDFQSNLTSVTMENGSIRTTTYNFLNLPATVSVPVDGTSSNNLVTTLDYDYNGRQTTVTSPDGLVTTMNRNQRGELVKVSYSDGTNRQWGYDGNGNNLWRQNGRGQITYYAYDNIGQLTSIDYQSPTTHDVSFTYRKDGLRSSRADALGTTSWVYNNAKELKSLTDAATTQTLTFSYQANTGRIGTMVAPGNTWYYNYDSLARPWFIAQSLSGEVVRNSLFYDDGSIKTKIFPNNTKTEFTYDNRGRATQIRHAVNSLDLTQEMLNYSFSNGRMSQYALTINGGPSYFTQYGYDSGDRLTSEVRTDSTGVNAYNNQYAYTKGDDRTSTVRNGVFSAYTSSGGANRFKSGEGFTVNTYDNDGNPTSITVPNSGTWTLTYDEDSRLTQILKPGGNASFLYDGDGQRVGRVTFTSTYRYLIHNKNLVLTTTSNPSYTIQAYYTPGVGYFTGGQMFYYQANSQGSPLVVRDSAGNWMSLTEYDAFGSEYDVQGTQKSDLRFNGAYGYTKDDATGMELLGSRYYLPVLGRFLSQDPIGLKGGSNLYAYCGNSPLDKVDPDGKFESRAGLGKLMQIQPAFHPFIAKGSDASNSSTGWSWAYSLGLEHFGVNSASNPSGLTDAQQPNLVGFDGIFNRLGQFDYGKTLFQSNDRGVRSYVRAMMRYLPPSFEVDQPLNLFRQNLNIEGPLWIGN